MRPPSNARASPAYVITPGLLSCPHLGRNILLARLPWYALYILALRPAEIIPWYELDPNDLDPRYLGAIYSSLHRLRTSTAATGLTIITHPPWGVCLDLPTGALLTVTAAATTAAELICPQLRAGA